MNAERLLAQFERISEAPDAIARLRRFILDLAVRGKLVEQDPEDEPAEELLRCITNHRKDLVHGTRQESPFSFELPTGWMHTTLRALVETSSSGWSPKTLDTPREGDEWGILKVSAVSWNQFRPEANKQVLLGTQPRPQAIVQKGDFLISRANTAELVARAVIVEREPVNLMMSDKIVRLDLVELCEAKYILIVNNHFSFSRAYYAERATGVSPSMKNVTRDVILGLPIPLPPLAEQHRIVAKVDELMALCDQLEAARQKREQGREHLVAATLQRLNQPAADLASFRQDASFALQVLPSLTTTPAQIKQLRQTILNLAVRGKLVEQDPEDESAADLIRKISEEKPALLAKGGFRSFVGKLNRDGSAFIFGIPSTWEWCFLDDISAIGRGGSPRPIQAFITDSQESMPWIKISDSARGSVYINNTQERITLAGISRSRIVVPGDLLLSNSMSFGFPYISMIEGCIHDGWLVIRTPEGLINKLYLRLLLLSDHARAAFAIAASGAVVQNLNADKVRQLAVPLPPLAEQHRIVAKVDELMALCDQLEQQLSQADQQRRRLLEAVLAEVLGGRLPTEEESHATVA
jgi:type I restriction enzyme S subunit